MPCPRCNRKLLINHDEAWCIVHGTVYYPTRATDAVSDYFDQRRAGYAPPSAKRRGKE